MDSKYIITPDGNFISGDELRHWGIKGMKWGVRRYQNPDGSLTDKGRKRYLREDGTFNDKGFIFEKGGLNFIKQFSGGYKTKSELDSLCEEYKSQQVS